MGAHPRSYASSGSASCFTTSSGSSSQKSESSRGHSRAGPQAILACQRFLELILPEYNTSAFSFKTSLSTISRNAIQDCVAEYRDINRKTDRCNPFSSILNIIAADTKALFSSQKSAQQEPIIAAMRSENIILEKFSGGQQLSSNTPHPSEWLMFFVVDRPRKAKGTGDNKPNRYLQRLCESYARKLLSSGYPRRNVLGAYVTEDKLFFVYYDHSIIIISDPFSWIDEIEAFSKIIHTLACLSDNRLGLETSVFSIQHPLPGECSPEDAKFHRILKLDDIELQLRDVIHERSAIVGRGTCTLRARILNGIQKNRTVAVKFSYTPSGRNQEVHIVKESREKASSSENSRKFLKTLPDIISHKIVPATVFQEELRKELGDRYELRDLNVVVSEELFPIHKLTNDAVMGKVFQDIFECHYWLYSEMKLLHRDISASNLMYRKEDGGVYGVLNDFDHASFLKDIASEPSSRAPTGTLPFISLDLLRSSRRPIHLYRHDLESLCYVFYYIITSFENSKPLLKFPIKDWFTLDRDFLYYAKVEFMFCKDFCDPTSTFHRLKDLAFNLLMPFSNGYYYRADLCDKEDYDIDTLGGYITYTGFSKIFEQVTTL